MFVAYSFYFLRRFSDMEMHDGVGRFSQFNTSSKNIRSAGINGVWRDSGDDQRVTFPFIDQIAAAVERFLVRGSVGSREFHNSLTYNRTHPCFSSCLSDVVFKIVHVVEGSNAGPNQFGAGKFGAQANKFR